MPKRAKTDAAAASDKSTILVTGGAGFIGTHTLLVLLEHGYRCVVRWLARRTWLWRKTDASAYPITIPGA